MKEGWICPRCGKVNAPFIASCDCKPDKVVSNANSECSCGGEHEWTFTTGWSDTISSGITYTCKKCGQTKSVAFSYN